MEPLNVYIPVYRVSVLRGEEVRGICKGKMKKIVILVMTCNIPFFREEEKVLRTKSFGKSVMSGEYPGVEYWAYTASHDSQTHIDWDNHMLYVPVDDSLEGTYEKTRQALLLLDEIGVGYDYVMRMNTSTYLNVGLLRCFVDGIPENDSRLYGETVGCLRLPYEKDIFRYFSIRGNAMLIPRFWCDVLKMTPVAEELISKDRFSSELHMDKYNYDDSGISYVVNVMSGEFGLDPNDMFYTWKVNPNHNYNVGVVLGEGVYRDVISMSVRLYKLDNTTREYEFEVLEQMELHKGLVEPHDPGEFYWENIREGKITLCDFVRKKIKMIDRGIALEIINRDFEIEITTPPK